VKTVPNRKAGHATGGPVTDAGTVEGLSMKGSTSKQEETNCLQGDAKQNFWGTTRRTEYRVRGYHSGESQRGGKDRPITQHGGNPERPDRHTGDSAEDHDREDIRESFGQAGSP